MKLPNGDRAELSSKIEDYVLNPRHWEGRHRAKVFESVLGITLGDRELLRQVILSAADDSDEVQSIGNNGYGEVYVLPFPLETQRACATVLTVWIIRNSEDFPRLVTCYILSNMSSEIKMHDVVALLQEFRTKHFEEDQAVLLRRGQIGTVVMRYPDGTCDIEFSDRDGRAFAIVPLSPDQLMVLHDTADFAAA